MRGQTCSVNRALWFVAPRAIELRPIEIPPVGGADALVRTICSGVSSGTEMLAYRGELPTDLQIDEGIGALAGTFTYPFRYGYSCVGVVEAHGEHVDDLSVGDVVFAFQPHQERFVVRASELIAVGALDPRRAAMLPYVETALQVTLDAGQVLGETVVVVGLGVLGLLVATMLQRAGGRVIAIEPCGWRRAIAAELDCTVVEPGEAENVAAVPLVVECSGNPDALSSALGLLAHEGTALVASWYGSKPVSLPLGGDFHRRRLTIRSTQVSSIPSSLAGRWTKSGRLAHAVDLARTLPLELLATDTVPFEQAADGYRRVDAGESGLVHMAFGYR
jgi:2-desacetyl-2-hydroxyethyl bacteriochlorophyllide A dehydrogenase